MGTDTKAASYAAMAAEAEAAVAAMKDPELRRVAFEKILATLLESKPVGRGRSGTRHPARRARAAANAKTDGPSKKQRKGPKAYVEELIDEDFFKKQRTIADVKAELANRGRHIAITSLSGPLQSLTQDRRLRRQKAAANSKGMKTTYAYSNW